MATNPKQTSLHVVDFLRAGGTLADLETRYAIKSRHHLTHPNLVLLKYNQIASPFAEPLVRECRGLILDESADWTPVSRAFDKFFNHGEVLAASIDWRTARVQEKVDGSLCVLYCYRHVWHVATSGTPDGGGQIGASELTFADLFWRTLDELASPWGKAADLLPADESRVFMFELTSPLNRVVVPHQRASLTLLAVRDMETMQEEHPEGWSDLFPVVREFSLQSMADVLATFEHLDPLRQEGYVVVDGGFNRVKVKHPGYVAIHHIRGENGPTPRRMLEIVRSGEGAELLAHFPEWRPQYEEADSRLRALETEIRADFERISASVGQTGTQKEFALQAVKTRCSAALFLMRSGKIDRPLTFLAGLPIEKLEALLGFEPAEAA